MFATKQKSGQEAASMPANRGIRPVLPVSQHGTTEFLQRHLGNSRFQQLVTPAGPVLRRKCACGGTCTNCSSKQDDALPLQAKLMVGPANDRYEREADRVADTVMRMPSEPLQRQAIEGEETIQAKPLADQITPLLQRQPIEEEEEMMQPKRLVQRWAQADGGETAPPVAHDVLHAPGQPLDAAARTFMEPRFGADFSGVRVHTGAQAGEAARSVQARAYTAGRHVVFGGGEYTPGTEAGKRLMAHELTHVVQQGAAPSTQPGIAVGNSRNATRPWIQRARLPCTTQRTIALTPVTVGSATGSFATDLALANSILCQCGIELTDSGLGMSLSPNVLDMDPPLAALNSSGGTPHRELSGLVQNRPGGGGIHVYYVPAIQGGALATSIGSTRFTPSLPDSVVLSDAASTGSLSNIALAHELGHVLLDSGAHHATADNLMADGNVNTGAGDLEQTQCNSM